MMSHLLTVQPSATSSESADAPFQTVVHLAYHTRLCTAVYTCWDGNTSIQHSSPATSCLFLSFVTVLTSSADAAKSYLSRCNFVVRHTGIIPALLHGNADGVALSLVQHGGGGRTRVECHNTCITSIYIVSIYCYLYIYIYILLPIYTYIVTICRRIHISTMHISLHNTIHK